MTPPHLTYQALNFLEYLLLVRKSEKGQLQFPSQTREWCQLTQYTGEHIGNLHAQQEISHRTYLTSWVAYC